MKRLAVRSSSVMEIGYNPAERKLEVKFQSGNVYQYLSVPPAVYEAFMASESKGRFFNERIRDLYQCVQIP